MSRIRPPFLGILLLVAVPLFVGCGSKQEKGTVQGTVTYRGDAVVVGDVNLVSADGFAVLVKLNEKGQFTVDGDMPTGEYIVFISPPTFEPPAPGVKPRPTGQFVVPEQYQSPSSPLRITVKPGKNDVPIELTD
jgi:hypothetical protein